MSVLKKVSEAFEHCKVVPRESITLSSEVRNLCAQNSCGNYGKTWTCPPALAPLEEIQHTFNSFDNFIIVYQIYPIEDRLDWEGMMAGAEDFSHKLAGLNKELKDESPYLILGAGGCKLCKTCTYPKEPCRRAGEAIVSAEAYGIDVMKLMKDNEMKYNNGPDTITYIGGVLY